MWGCFSLLQVILNMDEHTIPIEQTGGRFCICEYHYSAPGGMWIDFFVFVFQNVMTYSEPWNSSLMLNFVLEM